ncbi:class I SAM-dependent methyltransferase [Thermogemmatispora sp.]|uniref:class I SAM-dependent methyltransferase n=1 Tax=Thermogemmatispora sp. TaxID=1968838 RepID=UPI0035E43D49
MGWSWPWPARLLGAGVTHPPNGSLDSGGPGPDGPYLLPRSRQEQRRLELQHFALRQLLGSSFLAPVQQPTSILDVGAGTGIWLREAAHRWPQAQLVALDKDLSLLRWPLPARCRAVQADLLTGHPFPAGQFSYVHQRLLAAAIPTIPITAWPAVLCNLLRVTAPGGWLELVEATGQVLHEGPHHQQARTWFEALAVRRGLQLDAPPHLPVWLRALGLEPVVHSFVAPLSGRRYGAPLFQQDLLASVNQVPLEQIEQTLAALPVEREQYQTGCGGMAVWGQHP